jgi:hypothetical protein
MGRFIVSDHVVCELASGETLTLMPNTEVYYSGAETPPGMRRISGRDRPIEFDRAPGRQSALQSPSSEVGDRPLWCGFKPVPKDEQEQNKPPMLSRE